MFHPISRHGLADAKLDVPLVSFAEATARFPHDERTALRAWARSEANRLANKLVGAGTHDESFDALICTLVDLDWARKTSLKSRRFDLVVMLMHSGRFERRIAERLFAKGQISAATAETVGVRARRAA